MSLSNGIQQFLAGVDPVILSRGQDYFRSGNVESIEWDDLHMTAEVSGNEDEPYLVDIDFNEDGEVEAWECDCPYDCWPSRRSRRKKRLRREMQGKSPSGTLWSVRKKNSLRS